MTLLSRFGRTAARNRPGAAVYILSMELNAIVTEICRQADDFLAGVAKRDEARAGISEWLTIHYASLAPSAKNAVVEQSMRVLDHEGFFDLTAGATDEDEDREVEE